MATPEDDPYAHTDLWLNVTVHVHRRVPSMSPNDRVRLSINPGKTILMEPDEVDSLIAQLQEARAALRCEEKKRAVKRVPCSVCGKLVQPGHAMVGHMRSHGAEERRNSGGVLVER